MGKTDLSLIQKFREFIGIYLASLSVKGSKSVPKQKRDQHKMKILEFSYGLNGIGYSMAELAWRVNLSEAAILTIKKSMISEIAGKIREVRTDLFTEYYLDEIRKLDQYLKKQQVWPANKFYSWLDAACQHETEKKADPYIQLLLDILGYKIFKIPLRLLNGNNVIFFNDSPDPDLFLKIVVAAFRIAERNAVIIEKEEIVSTIKQNLKSYRVDRAIILSALNVIDDFEWPVKDGTRFCQVALHRLSSASDMAYRILFEKGEKMRLTDIYDELILRLEAHTHRIINKASLNSEMNSDKRFTPPGKTRVWTLAEWEDDSPFIYEFVIDTLMHFDKPLFKDDLFAHILKIRPWIKIDFLNSILHTSRFVQLHDKRYIPAIWADAYKTKIKVKTK